VPTRQQRARALVPARRQRPLDVGGGLLPPRPRCGRGIGEKRLAAQALARDVSLFEQVAAVRQFLRAEGHALIVASGTLLAADAHRNLDRLVELLEDFLWVVNTCIARDGGTPRLV